MSSPAATGAGRRLQHRPGRRDAHPDWKDEIHVSVPEREAFRRLLDLGLADAFRLFEQPEKNLQVLTLKRVLS